MSILNTARRRAESRMTDVVEVTRLSTDETYDPATDTFSVGTTSTVYSGKARMKTQSPPSDITVAGEIVQQMSMTALIPVSITDVQVGDVLTVSSSATDPWVETTKFTVKFVDLSTQKTSRRLYLEVSVD